MSWESFIKPDSNKLILVFYLFVLLNFLAGFKVTYVPDQICSMQFESGISCKDIKSPAIGIPAFSYSLYGGGDFYGNDRYFSWPKLGVNLLWVYLLACFLSVKTSFLSFSKTTFLKSLYVSLGLAFLLVFFLFFLATDQFTDFQLGAQEVESLWALPVLLFFISSFFVYFILSVYYWLRPPSSKGKKRR